ncbi:hypothetical protein Tco_1580718, partial [Tanacetum coccineum]
ILLVQVYVDDIIFGSTRKSLCDEFEGLMHKEFQISSMGELTFFLGLQTASTPMDPDKALVKDEEAEDMCKQTIVANSTTEAEYVATANCCEQNPVFHSKTKHIKIRHHFIRDSYEKKLIQVIKIYTDQNVADLLTKAFDVSRFGC